MTEPNLDQELERLLNATRAGTEPDANARVRVRAALAVGLAGTGAVKAGITTRVGLGAKLWLLSALVAAVLVGVSLLGPPPESASAPTSASGAAEAALPAAPPAAAPPAAPAGVEPAPPAAAVSGAIAPSATGSAPPAPRSSNARISAKAEEPADELALVSAMQLALRSGNAAQALALANEHARRFPGGALAQEREGARAIAHCQLAEPASRPAILANFEQRYAGSPYAARVRDACTR